MPRYKLCTYPGGHRTGRQPSGISTQLQRVTLLSSDGKAQFGWWEASVNQFLVLCSELPSPRQKQGRLSAGKVPEMEIVILHESGQLCR